MSECAICQAIDSEDGSIQVGLTGHSSESTCTVCRAEELVGRTTLSQREAEVAAHKQITGASHSVIAERIGVDKSTVDEYSSRLRSKAQTAAVTADELSEFY